MFCVVEYAMAASGRAVERQLEQPDGTFKAELVSGAKKFANITRVEPCSTRLPHKT
jgi:hypothetical protein